MYDYKFVRLGEGLLDVKSEALDSYQAVIQEYGGQGWRLVQVFAPPIGPAGRSLFYELIFERARVGR